MYIGILKNPPEETIEYKQDICLVNMMLWPVEVQGGRRKAILLEGEQCVCLSRSEGMQA